jgi:IS5 family transposase
MLFKALLFEAWYGLSEAQVVQEIHDRRSFERFVGPDIRAYHLDDTTLVKFRGRLRDSGIIDRVWSEVDKALARRGLVVGRP